MKIKNFLVLSILSTILCGSASYGLTAETEIKTERITIRTDSSISIDGGLQYNGEGVLTGCDMSDISFKYNYGAVSSADWLIYTGINHGTETAFGLWVTETGAITGAWKSDKQEALSAWTNNGTVALSVFEDKSTPPKAGSIALSVGLSATEGVTLTTDEIATFDGNDINANNTTAETAGDLYRASTLKSATADTTNVILNTKYIPELYLTDSVVGNTTYTSNGKSIEMAPDTHLDVTSARVQLNGGADGNAAAVNTSGKSIFVGGAGQLFLQTWNTGAIELNNDIYAGSSTHKDANQFGVIRIGNDGNTSTSLNGKIVVLEDTSIKSNGTQAIYITGTVTDKQHIDGSVSEGGKNLTVGGKGFTFTGTVDVTTITLTDGTAASFSDLQTTCIILGTNTSITLATLSNDAPITLGGSILNGLEEIGSSVNLFTVTTLAGWDPGTADYMMATNWFRFDSETLASGVNTSDLVVKYSESGMVSLSVLATNSPVVPEPATATLSLLALAGLAARRRRK